MTEQNASESHIFISYRRDDSIAHVNGLFLPLREHFGKQRVFKDTDNIPPGRDFRKVIEKQLESCSVLLAVIGKNWVTAQKPKSNVRRLDDPNDYLRAEVATALRNERVLVIPILVGQATMPSAEELPQDLAQLSYLNAFELRDSRWESDIRLLIDAIESAEVQTRTSPTAAVAPLPPPVETSPLRTPDEPDSVIAEDDDFDLLELRRKRQIAEHIKTAREALAAHDYAAVLEECEKAIWLDAKHAEARDLRRRARAALDEDQISGWLTQAQEVMTRATVEDADLALASGLIDQALALNPTHTLAVERRQEILSIRKQRERQREIERQVRAALARALVSFEEENFDGAIEYCDDALLLSSESQAALALREKAVAAKAEQQRQRDLKRKARRAAEAAQAAERSAVAEEPNPAAAETAIVTPSTATEVVAPKPVAPIVTTADVAAATPVISVATATDVVTPKPIDQAPTPADISRPVDPVSTHADVVIPASDYVPPAPAPPTGLRFDRRAVAAAIGAVVLVGALVGWVLLGRRPATSEVSVQTSDPVAGVSGPGSPASRPTSAVDLPPNVAKSGATEVKSGATEATPSRDLAPSDLAPSDTVTPPTSPVADAGAATDLVGLRQRAQAQYRAGQRSDALAASIAGLKIDPNDADLLRTLGALRSDAVSNLQKTKKDATALQAASRAPGEFKDAAQKETQALALRNSDRPDEAIRALWAAADGYAKAHEHARQITSQLNAAASRARTELQSGERTDALNTIVAALRLDPAFAPLLNMVGTMWREAEAAVERSKRHAAERGAHVASAAEFQEALRKETAAATLRDAKNFGEAIKSLWAADDLFAEAAARADAAREAAKPAPPTRGGANPAASPQPFLSDIFISSAATSQLTPEIVIDKDRIDRATEVVRGGPVAAVVWTSGCRKESDGSCKLSAEILVYAPDGSVFQRIPNLDLPRGAGAVPLKFDAQTPPGIYRVVARVRDLASPPRFATLERHFGVK